MPQVKHEASAQPPLPGKDGKPQRKARLEALPALRFLAELQIVGYHFYLNTENPQLNRFNEWGACPLTFFFLLSGFIFGYIYGGRDGFHRLEWWDFMCKRLAGLYPLYLASILLGYAVSWELQPRPLGLLVVLLLTASKAVPSAFFNPISTPAWTVGAFLVIYSILPFSLRLLKAASPSARLWVLPPLFYLASMAYPATMQGYNTGILHVYTRAIGLCSASNFLQGVNLGLLFLHHNWEKHPAILQRIGASAALVSILLISVYVDVNTDLSIFVQIWRDHGLFQPLYCLLIWYVARDRDLICLVLKAWPLRFLGNISYGMYLFQAVVYEYLKRSTQDIARLGFIRAKVFLPLLVAVAAFGVHGIQGWYTDPLAKLLKRKVDQFLTSPTSVGARLWRLSLVFLESGLSRALALVAFLLCYVLFVNYQGCTHLICYLPDWAPFPFPSCLADRTWFSQQEVNWFIAWWALPCERRSFLSPDSPALSVLLLLLRTSRYLAMPALLLRYCTTVLPSLLPRSRFLDRCLAFGRRQESESSQEAAATAGSARSLEEGKASATRHPVSWGCERLFVRLLLRPSTVQQVAEDSIRAHAQMLQRWSCSCRQPVTLEVLGLDQPSSAEVLLAQLPPGASVLRVGGEAPEPACSDDELSWSKLDSVASAEDSEKYLCVLILCREEGQQQLTAKRRGDGALVEAVEAGRRWSKAREGDGVIYLEGHVRLDEAALSECLQYLSSKQQERVAVVDRLGVEGRDGDDAPDVLPGLYAMGHLPHWQDACPGQAVLLVPGQADQDVVSTVLPASNVQRAPATLTVLLLRRGRVYFHNSSFAQYLASRRYHMRCMAARHTRLATASRLLLDCASHVCFLAAAAVLVLSPVYRHYVPADGMFQYSGAGFDCQNGYGYDHRPYRWTAAIMAAAYTGVYFYGFLQTFRPKDGLIRQCILLFVLLASLPLLSLLELFLAVTALPTILLRPLPARPATTLTVEDKAGSSISSLGGSLHDERNEEEEDGLHLAADVGPEPLPLSHWSSLASVRRRTTSSARYSMLSAADLKSDSEEDEEDSGDDDAADGDEDDEGGIVELLPISRPSSTRRSSVLGSGPSFARAPSSSRGASLSQ